MKTKTRFLVQAGLIAALYSALVIAGTFTPVGFLNFGPIQLRISEALTVLPYFTPAAIPGLFVGCMLSNAIGAAFSPGFAILGWWDVVIGSLATLAAALSTRAVRRAKWLAPLPPVLINAAVIGSELMLATHTPFWINALTVGAGEAVACFGLGMPLLLLLEKRRSLFQ